MTKYLMNVITGSVDTLENWESDFRSMSEEQWGGTEFMTGLVEVVKDESGEWVEL